MSQAPKFDVSKLSDEELQSIQHEVTRAVAMRMRAENADGHDSHGSSHSKNNVNIMSRVGGNVESKRN